MPEWLFWKEKIPPYLTFYLIFVIFTLHKNKIFPYPEKRNKTEI